MKSLAFLLILHCAAIVSSIDLPEYFPTCYRDDDNMEDCLIKASESLKPYLSVGFPEFKIPKLEPLTLEIVDVAQSAGDYEYKAHIFNFTFAGLSNYTFEKLRFNPKTLTLYGRVSLSPILLSGKLRLDGKVVVVPVNADGTYTALMGPITTNFTITGKLEERKGEEYITPVKINTQIEIKDIDFYVFDLFNENAHLSGLTRMLFNANSELIMSKSGPVFEQISDSVVAKYVKKFTKAVPYNKIFPLKP